MSDDLDHSPPLHTIQDIVTPGPHNAARRMRVPGGWLYWVFSGYGSDSAISSFVPDVATSFVDTSFAAPVKRAARGPA